MHVDTDARRGKCSRVVTTLHGNTKPSAFVVGRWERESVCLLLAAFDVLLLVGGVLKLLVVRRCEV